MNENGVHYRPEELSGLIDTGRDPAEVVRGDSHLSRCPECRAILNQLARLDRSLRDMPPPRLDQKFTDRVMAQIVRSAQSPAGYRLVTWGASVLVAVVGLVFIVGGYAVVGALSAPARDSSVAVALEQTVTGVGQAVTWGSSWLTAHLGGLASNSTMNTWIVAVAGGVALVVLDWILSRRLGQRTRSTP